MPNRLLARTGESSQKRSENGTGHPEPDHGLHHAGGTGGRLRRGRRVGAGRARSGAGVGSGGPGGLSGSGGRDGAVPGNGAAHTGDEAADRTRWNGDGDQGGVGDQGGFRDQSGIGDQGGVGLNGGSRWEGCVDTDRNAWRTAGDEARRRGDRGRLSGDG